MAESKNKRTKEVGGAKEYKVIGEKFSNKVEAITYLEKVFEKWRMGARLLVQDNEFVVLYGTYETKLFAEASVEVLKKQGFVATIMEQ